jgi:GT2 family glycosyltransferase
MIKKAVFEKIGFLSEDYFMYMEDVEFCLRAKKQGYKIMNDPEVSIIHLSGGSSKNPKLRQWLGEYKGLLILYKNYYGIIATFLVRILIYIATILRILAFALIGKYNVSLTYAKVITSI